jgi:hypothetical protein
LSGSREGVGRGGPVYVKHPVHFGGARPGLHGRGRGRRDRGGWGEFSSNCGY